MSKDLGIVVIHGIGETTKDYHFGLQESIKRKLDKPSWSKLHFEPIFYQNLIQQNQYNIWERMVQKEVLDWKGLRKFMLFGFGDVASLEHKADTKSAYHKVQKAIVEALRKTRKELGDRDKNIILIAQSFGGQIISNYIWDFQNKKGGFQPDNNPDFIQLASGEESFLKLNSLRYFFTTGCNIPLFVAGFNEIYAIKKPNKDFKWFNYFDKDDVLGWPLKPLSESYEKVVEKDIEINAGNFFIKGWNPLSHTGYWTDKDFVNPLCKTIQSLL